MAAKTNKKAKPAKKKKPTKAQFKKIEQAKAKAKRISDRHDKAMKVIDLIETGGKSMNFALTVVKMSTKTFYQWRAYLTDEEVEEGLTEGENGKRYAHACAERRLFLLEQTIDISDDQSGDQKEFTKNGKIIKYEDKEFTSRSKLRIETRMKYLAMVEPEKYGNNIQVKTEQDIKISFKG